MALTSPDFPGAAHERLNLLVLASDAKMHPVPGQTKLYRDYATAHNSILWRFRSVADSDDAYRKAYSIPNEGDCTEKTYLLERALFEFFAALVSCIEVFCYCSYAIAAMCDATAFPLATEKDCLKVKPEPTKDKFANHYPAERIVSALDAMLRDYADAKKMRNVLSHRGSPGRDVFVFLGDLERNYTTWGTPSMSKHYKFDEKLTATNRTWLAQHIGTGLDVLCEFVQCHLS